MDNGIFDFLVQNLNEFIAFTGFANATPGHYFMIAMGLIFLYLGIGRKLEPMLLVPIGFGILIGNIPFLPGTQVGIYEEGSLLYFLHFGLLKGIYPPLIFLGLGAMIDFSAVISNPKLFLIGIAAQLGIFAAYMISLQFGFTASEAGAIGIIGSADGPTSIFLSSRLAPELMGAIAISAYSYMALVPVIQPPIMRLLTTKKERVIRMRPPRVISSMEKIIFPIVGLLLTCFLVPAGLPLLGMLFFGNLLKECGVTKRLATTASGPMTDVLTILIGLTMGVSTQATTFLTTRSLFIFGIGAISFIVATAAGILFVKFLNLFLREGNKINPLIGNAGVSALPDSARVSQMMGLEYDKNNHLLMHAMGPTVASTIGSAVVAGVMLGFLG
ncbi:sodium ion-translocating decarboxylase subunit beta [Proteiniphilum sp.]|uniref:sodium ion-translocating decarboxylase subunit beta n=1 Tax=Proteiniphilum sp. TaxID=1926877 RepID=UPI002B1F684D|nr:sodium ion-translocating decarboxylase subunit beta [Proteiniphilum sp.]MEA4919084.1 sodium ion-translocating decarboxylase subunit beta [Proteiniphilum sp.]